MLLFTSAALACTDFIATPGATVDGSTLIAYNADSEQSVGAAVFYERGTPPAGTMRDIYDWESGQYLGSIPEASQLYRVVGNINEHGVAISESTFGGRDELTGTGIVDYGSLIYIALQRTRTAREAITLMGGLVERYGYASTGETFSIGDTTEAWVMEMVGTGQWGKGAVWVARRIPDGYVCAHANQARITTFPLFDPTNSTLYSPDVISFARARGYIPDSQPDAEFSFSDTYCPVSFFSARICEARVWQIFTAAGADVAAYVGYASGHDLTHRMPLWVKPGRALSARDAMRFQGLQYEDTPFNFTSDPSAGWWAAPYRVRPLTWKDPQGGGVYFNERAPGTQQTAFSMVAQLRGANPPPTRGLLWFAVDDASMVVYTPLYCNISAIPPAYVNTTVDAAGGSLMAFNWQQAFWVFNVVSNFVYAHHRLAYPVLRKYVDTYQANLLTHSTALEAAVAVQWAKGDEAAARAAVDAFSTTTANTLVADWQTLFGNLFVQFMDFTVRTVIPGSNLPNIVDPGTTDTWRAMVARETGDRYRAPEHLKSQRVPRARGL